MPVAQHRRNSGPSAPRGDGARADPAWQSCQAPGPQDHGLGSIVYCHVEPSTDRDCSAGQDRGASVAPSSPWVWGGYPCWAEETHSGKGQNRGPLTGWPLPRATAEMGALGATPTPMPPVEAGQPPTLCSPGDSRPLGTRPAQPRVPQPRAEGPAAGGQRGRGGGREAGRRGGGGPGSPGEAPEGARR